MSGVKTWFMSEEERLVYLEKYPIRPVGEQPKTPVIVRKKRERLVREAQGYKEQGKEG